MATRLAQAQLATMPERVAVVETKVDSMIVCIEEIKGDVKEMHDCLDRTRDEVLRELKEMQKAYWDNAKKYYEHAEDLNTQQSEQHDELAGKIKELQSVKDKWVKYSLAAMAFAVGAGWINSVNLPTLLKFLGL